MTELAKITIRYTEKEGFELLLTDESSDIFGGGKTAIKTNHAAVFGELIMKNSRDLVNLSKDEVKTEFIKTLGEK